MKKLKTDKRNGENQCQDILNGQQLNIKRVH